MENALSEYRYDALAASAGCLVDSRPDPRMKKGHIGDATISAIKVYVFKRVADCSREESVFDLP
jgi:hypothetical protein